MVRLVAHHDFLLGHEHHIETLVLVEGALDQKHNKTKDHAMHCY
jgi:hypothetical protein